MYLWTDFGKDNFIRKLEDIYQNGENDLEIVPMTQNEY